MINIMARDVPYRQEGRVLLSYTDLRRTEGPMNIESEPSNGTTLRQGGERRTRRSPQLRSRTDKIEPISSGVRSDETPLEPTSPLRGYRGQEITLQDLLTGEVHSMHFIANPDLAKLVPPTARTRWRRKHPALVRGPEIS